MIQPCPKRGRRKDIECSSLQSLLERWTWDVLNDLVLKRNNWKTKNAFLDTWILESRLIFLAFDWESVSFIIFVGFLYYYLHEHKMILASMIFHMVEGILKGISFIFIFFLKRFYLGKWMCVNCNLPFFFLFFLFYYSLL